VNSVDQPSDQIKLGDASGDNHSILLTVEGLTKRYDRTLAVNGLSFSIRSGEIYGLLGPNGAGKTTTIKSLLGMLEIDGGRISLLGKNPMKQAKEVKALIGYVAEEPLLYDSMTPRELFDFIASVRQLDPTETRSRIRNLLTSLDATKYYDDLIGTLSKGNKQKMQIVAALMSDPELLILDEPLTGLDAKSRRIVRNILELHTKSGKSVMLSTHAMEDAQGLCDRIGIINQGQLIAEGTLDELNRIGGSSELSLEQVFLKLTNQEQSVEDATAMISTDYEKENLEE